MARQRIWIVPVLLPRPRRIAHALHASFAVGMSSKWATRLLSADILAASTGVVGFDSSNHGQQVGATPTTSFMDHVDDGYYIK